MSESTAAKSPPLRAQRNPWDQQPDERALWYGRFLRFVALGPTRSVSLVATGKRNSYPVPAHWPMVAKRDSWRERAKAFDEAAKADPAVIAALNNTLDLFAKAATNGEREPLELAIKAGGYQVPKAEDYDPDEGSSSISATGT